MKKHILLGCISAILLSLCACGTQSQSVPATGTEDNERTTESSLAPIQDIDPSESEAEPVADKIEGLQERFWRLSMEDQKIIDELGYLTHHETVESDSLEWTCDGTTITITGSGPMKDYYSEDPEWAQYRETAQTVVIGDGITTVGAYAFYDYLSLTHVELPDSVEYIGDSAFANDCFLDEVPLPASLKEIGRYAFLEVKLHKPLVIPEGVEILGAGCFHANDFWDTISIPSSVYYIDEGAFSNSLHLHEFIVDSANEYYRSDGGVLFDIDKTALLGYPLLKEDTDYAIPDTVTLIGYFAFDINEFLQRLTIPASVRSISDGNFALARMLERVTVDPKNEYFKDDDGVLYSADGKTLYIYPHLSDRTEYSILEGTETICFRCFTETAYLDKLTLPAGIKHIDEQAFSDMNGTEIIIPESFTETVEECEPWIFWSQMNEWDTTMAISYTYVPNDYNGSVEASTIPYELPGIYYEGSSAQWQTFVDKFGVDLGQTPISFGK